MCNRVAGIAAHKKGLNTWFKFRDVVICIFPAFPGHHYVKHEKVDFFVVFNKLLNCVLSIVSLDHPITCSFKKGFDETPHRYIVVS